MRNNVTPIILKSKDAPADEQNHPPSSASVNKHGMDYALFIMIVVICAFGLVMLFSASYYYARHEFGDGFKYLKSQSKYIIAGIALMFGFSFIDYRNYGKKWLVGSACLAVLVMLIGVLLPGIGVFHQGAKRWLNLGIITIQPSEFVKFIIVLMLAAYMSEKAEYMPYFLNGTFPVFVLMGSIIGAIFVYRHTETKGGGLIVLLILFVLAVFGIILWYFLTHKQIIRDLFRQKAYLVYLMLITSCILIYLQPNLSTLALVALITVTMLYIGGASWKYILCMVGIGFLLFLILVFIAPYRSNRIDAWLHPWDNTDDKSFQVVQSFYALGGGGLFGRGFNASRQKLLFLPYRESDFIFAIICEEFGFAGGILLMAAYAFIIYRGIRIAKNVRNKFASLLAAGITSILAWQVIINIAVVTGMAPATGQTLPFISSGGTSAIVFLCAMGILLNISKFTELKKQ